MFILILGHQEVASGTSYLAFVANCVIWISVHLNGALQFAYMFFGTILKPRLEVKGTRHPLHFGFVVYKKIFSLHFCPYFFFFKGNYVS